MPAAAPSRRRSACRRPDRRRTSRRCRRHRRPGAAGGGRSARAAPAAAAATSASRGGGGLERLRRGGPLQVEFRLWTWDWFPFVGSDPLGTLSLGLVDLDALLAHVLGHRFLVDARGGVDAHALLGHDALLGDRTLMMQHDLVLFLADRRAVD